MNSNDRGRTGAMSDLFAQAMRLPLSAIMFSVEWMLRAMQGLQGGSPPPALTNPAQGTAGTGEPPASNRPSTSPQEGWTTMDSDQDLSGDDLKFVSYAILFTKRDLEATLEKSKEELINYSTDGGSFGALKIADFLAKVGEGKVKRPQVWADNNYPPGYEPGQPLNIPHEDRRYIRFVYAVEDRLDRQSAHYDRDQTKALQEISSALSGLSAKIG
jgi:hypothetical protein